MKILFLGNAESIHTVRWVNALSERDHEVHLVYKFDDEPKVNEIFKKVVLHRLKYSGSKGYILNAKQLQKLFKIIKPDVVNAHYASGYGTLARMAKTKPLILSVWGSDVYDFPYQNWLKMKLVVDNLNYADEIASSSEGMALQVRKLLKNNKVNITITPFGIDLNVFNKTKELSKIKKNDIVIGNIKSLKEVYGLNYLIYATKILKEQLELNNNKDLSDRIKVYIYGKGPEKEKLINLIQELKLENTVFLKGEIPNKDVPNALEFFDIFCATSVQESFGVSLLEAMSMELPIVATDVPGFREVVDNNKTGIIVENKNPKAISRALEKMVYSKELRALMGKAGRERVETLFSWNENVERMITLYNKVLERTQG